MANLLPLTPISTANAISATAPIVCVLKPPRNLCVQANFVYGSGGTSVDVYIQTSIDGGSTWSDIANFHFTTASGRKAINLSSLTPVTTQATLTDGSMTANTAQDGLLGDRFRIKWGSTGTYAGTTTLQIDASWSFE